MTKRVAKERFQAAESAWTNNPSDFCNGMTSGSVPNAQLASSKSKLSARQEPLPSPADATDAKTSSQAASNAPTPITAQTARKAGISALMALNVFPRSSIASLTTLSTDLISQDARSVRLGSTRSKRAAFLVRMRSQDVRHVSWMLTRMRLTACLARIIKFLQPMDLSVSPC